MQQNDEGDQTMRNFLRILQPNLKHEMKTKERELSVLMNMSTSVPYSKTLKLRPN